MVHCLWSFVYLKVSLNLRKWEGKKNDLLPETLRLSSLTPMTLTKADRRHGRLRNDRLKYTKYEEASDVRFPNSRYTNYTTNSAGFGNPLR